MNALTEAQVRVGFAAHIEVIGADEGRLVPVGRALPHQYLVAGMYPVTAQRHLAGRRPPLGRRRRRPAHHLLHRGGQQSGIAAQPAVLVRMLGEGEQSAGDRVTGGLRARAEQQAEEHVQLDVGKRWRRGVIDGGVRDDRQHVVGRLGTLLRDQLGTVGAHPRSGFLHGEPGDLPLPGTAEVEARFDRLEEPVPFGLGNAEQNADHLHRQLGRDVDDEVERRIRFHGIEQRAGPSPQIALDATDHPRRQTRTDQSADLGVARIVHHVQHLAGDRQVLQQSPAEGPITPRHR